LKGVKSLFIFLDFKISVRLIFKKNRMISLFVEEKRIRRYLMLWLLPNKYLLVSVPKIIHYSLFIFNCSTTWQLY